jgi:nicotinamide riboside kinase
MESRRLILSGTCATGKSFLARRLADYLALRICAGQQQHHSADSIIDEFRLPEDDADSNGKCIKIQAQMMSAIRRHRQK